MAKMKYRVIKTTRLQAWNNGKEPIDDIKCMGVNHNGSKNRLFIPVNDGELWLCRSCFMNAKEMEVE